MNDDTQKRRRAAEERYNRLAAPYVDRMVDLRLIFTRPLLVTGTGPCYEWTNAAAEDLYNSYESILKQLLDTCTMESAFPLLPALPVSPGGRRCDDCAPEFACWISGGICRKQ
jgi:hypothetical protein